MATAVTVGGLTVKVAVFVTEAIMPLMVAVMAVGVAAVVTGNVAVVWPARTVTEASTVTPLATLSDESVTARPPVGAALVIVTVPVDPAAPSTEDGATVTDTSVGAVMVSGAEADEPLKLALMLAVASEATATVETVKVADVCPAGTVTVVGTVAVGLSEVRAITASAAGAVFSVTVAVDGLPPTTEVGLRVTEATVTGVIVSVSDAELAP